MGESRRVSSFHNFTLFSNGTRGSRSRAKILPVNPARLPLNSWVSSLRRSRTRMRWAFTAIIVFLFVQVIWWVVFQHGYIVRTVEHTAAQWASEARVAELALQNARPEARPAILERLRTENAHLNLDTRPISVDAGALEAFRARQQRYLNMFAYEVPFFLFVMLVGLWVIARSARSDFELKRRQQNFLMAATHEFRTPISTLRLLVETAQYRELPRTQQLEVLTTMNAEVSRLQAVSERVLATARLEQGVGVQTLEIRDWRTVIRALVVEHRPSLEAAGATLELRLPAEPVPVAIDPAAFAIVFQNLVENAVKYSPGATKPVTVALEVQGSRAHGLQAHFSVTDAGVGVAPAEMPHIFDQFYRAGNELTRSAKGLGLGLYLVRGIAGLMHGSVRCENVRGENGDMGGARFTVSLPLALEETPVRVAPRGALN
jgi:signal transduction histidine kinase